MVSCHCESDVVTLCHGVTRFVSRYVTCSLYECWTPTDTLSPVLDSLVPLSALRPLARSSLLAQSKESVSLARLSHRATLPGLRRDGPALSARKVGPTPTHLLTHTAHTR